MYIRWQLVYIWKREEKSERKKVQEKVRETGSKKETDIKLSVENKTVKWIKRAKWTLESWEGWWNDKGRWTEGWKKSLVKAGSIGRERERERK